MSFARFLFIAAVLATIMPLAAMAQTPAPAVSAASSSTVNASAGASGASSPASAPVTRAEIPELVKQAIMNDPDIIMQAAQKLREKQAAESEKQAQGALEKHKADLLDDDASPIAGNTKTPDITVVEFFDYHCGYCKHMLPAITQLMKDDDKVRVVFKEFPILSEDSVTASRAALAVYHIAPDKYFDYYTELMQSNGKFDEKSLLSAAKKVGINTEKLKTEMAKPEITAELDKNRDIAKDMGINGTPALIIGDHLMPGALPYEDLKKAVAEVRSEKKSAAEAPKS